MKEDAPCQSVIQKAYIFVRVSVELKENLSDKNQL